MYPLILTPTVKDYIWGGTRLREEYGVKTDLSKAAEAWVLSCRDDGPCTVQNGEMAGKTLKEVIDIWGDAATGPDCKKFEFFPLLIKLIDARDRLSIQVHPDDEYAAQHGGGYGKTEMWYVVDCEEGASLIYGFNRDTDKEEFKRRIEDDTITDICNFVKVHKGDTFFIPSGTLHAIGAGILIAEVQQNSDTTYRVSDYGRPGADGKPRQLHINQALDVTSLKKSEYKRTAADSDRDGTELLADCKLFKAERLTLNGDKEIKDTSCFESLICLDGSFTILWDGGTAEIAKGGSVFIPCGVAVALQGNAVLLKTTV